MNYKSIFNLLGILLGIFSLSFVPPIVLAFAYEESSKDIFLYSFIFFAIFNNEVKVLYWEGNSPVSGQSGL